MGELNEWVDGLEWPWRFLVRPVQLLVYLAISGAIGLGGILLIAWILTFV